MIVEIPHGMGETKAREKRDKYIDACVYIIYTHTHCTDELTFGYYSQ